MELNMNYNSSLLENSNELEEIKEAIKEAHINGPQKIGTYKFKNILITLQK